MKVTFYAGSRKAADGTQEECDWVSIRTGFDGKDVIRRVATDDDKARFAVEYSAYLHSLSVPDTTPVVVESAPSLASTKKQKAPKV